MAYMITTMKPSRAPRENLLDALLAHADDDGWCLDLLVLRAVGWPARSIAVVMCAAIVLHLLCHCS